MASLEPDKVETCFTPEIEILFRLVGEESWALDCISRFYCLLLEWLVLKVGCLAKAVERHAGSLFFFISFSFIEAGTKLSIWWSLCPSRLGSGRVLPGEMEGKPFVKESLPKRRS